MSWRNVPDNYMPTAIADYIDEKYNVLDYFDLLRYDQDWDKLVEKLSKWKDHVFKPNDIFLVSHVDTDYYDNTRLKTGVSMGNLIRAFQITDTPLHSLFLFTTHHGIGLEITTLVGPRHSADQPRVFYAMVDKSMLDTVESRTFDVDHIQKHSICIAGQERSHRHAAVNEIYQRNLRDKVLLSYRAHHIEKHDLD